MRKCILGTLFVIFILVLSAGTVCALQFQVDEFRELPADFKAMEEPESDMDMNYCTVLRVAVDRPTDLSLQQKVYKKENLAENEYYFYISAKEDEITFTAPDYSRYSIDVENKIAAGKTYYVKLNSVQDIEVEINVEPQETELLVDGATWEDSKNILSPGQHYLLMRKPGYAELRDTITVNAENAVFNYQLAQKPVEEEKPKKDIKPEPVKLEEEKSAQEEKILSMEMNEYKVRFQKAEYKQRTLTVNLNITNLEPGRELTILSRKTKVYDTKGNEYSPETLQFANKKGDWKLTHFLVQDVPTNARLIFRELTKPLEKITLLKFVLWDPNNKEFTISFRNITVE